MHQETEGLLSPWIRDIRLKKVAQCIPNHTVVLDLACGNGYLSQFLPAGCKYYGVDRLEPSAHDPFTDFKILDLSKNSTFKELELWLPEKPNVITCIAFLEHISDPAAFLKNAQQLLNERGKIIGTTPHPRGRLVHDTLAKLHICSQSGADEHETFLGKKDLNEMALGANGGLTQYSPFLFGLNQLFTVEFPQK